MIVQVTGTGTGRRLLQTTIIGSAPIVAAASGLTSLVNVLVRCTHRPPVFMPEHLYTHSAGKSC